jgi:hypothetical protein
MKNAANVKYVAVTPPAAIVDNAAFTTTAIDTLGWRHLTILVIFGAIDIAPASASIRHSDNSNMSSPSTLATGGTDFALATATDSDNLFHVFEVDLQGKKRYLDFEITGGDGAAGSYISVIGILSRGEEAPNTATKKGAVVYASI